MIINLVQVALVLMLFASAQVASYCNTIEFFHSVAYSEECDDTDPEDVVLQDPFLLAQVHRTSTASNTSKHINWVTAAVVALIGNFETPCALYKSQAGSVGLNRAPDANNLVWLATRRLLI